MLAAAAAVREAWWASSVAFTWLRPCSAAHCDHSCSGRLTWGGAEAVRPAPRLYNCEMAGGRLLRPPTPEPRPGANPPEASPRVGKDEVCGAREVVAWEVVGVVGVEVWEERKNMWARAAKTARSSRLRCEVVLWWVSMEEAPRLLRKYGCSDSMLSIVSLQHGTDSVRGGEPLRAGERRVSRVRRRSAGTPKG